MKKVLYTIIALTGFIAGSVFSVSKISSASNAIGRISSAINMMFSPGNTLLSIGLHGTPEYKQKIAKWGQLTDDLNTYVKNNNPDLLDEYKDVAQQAFVMINLLGVSYQRNIAPAIPDLKRRENGISTIDKVTMQNIIPVNKIKLSEVNFTEIDTAIEKLKRNDSLQELIEKLANYRPGRLSLNKTKKVNTAHVIKTFAEFLEVSRNRIIKDYNQLWQAFQNENA